MMGGFELRSEMRRAVSAQRSRVHHAVCMPDQLAAEPPTPLASTSAVSSKWTPKLLPWLCHPCTELEVIAQAGSNPQIDSWRLAVLPPGGTVSALEFEEGSP